MIKKVHKETYVCLWRASEWADLYHTEDLSSRKWEINGRVSIRGCLCGWVTYDPGGYRQEEKRPWDAWLTENLCHRWQSCRSSSTTGSGITCASRGPPGTGYGRPSRTAWRVAAGRTWRRTIPSSQRGCWSWDKSRWALTRRSAAPMGLNVDVKVKVSQI